MILWIIEESSLMRIAIRKTLQGLRVNANTHDCDTAFVSLKTADTEK